jgi:nucleoside-diphosphate kinase
MARSGLRDVTLCAIIGLGTPLLEGERQTHGAHPRHCQAGRRPTQSRRRDCAAVRDYAVHKGKFFYEDLVTYISSSPVVAMVIEGHEAIKTVRAMVGSTRPYEAAPGTIRGDLALMGLRNLIHASDSPETSASEITLWFAPDQVLDYWRDIDKWVYEG